MTKVLKLSVKNKSFQFGDWVIEIYLGFGI
jgi:hypothetical protein